MARALHVLALIDLEPETSMRVSDLLIRLRDVAYTLFAARFVELQPRRVHAHASRRPGSR
ncbi:hypothetical protein D7S86_22035 [Pararobbsia silviterrae]|uniref:Uncharacterized protein n=1 Tax=Pararobbsia silviterrae TaxID=1792498 RepID=A0A494XG58_9BURK|nr:hypothetical protein D7S86_22035 [Pararobbsia silviterrae]